MAEPSPRSTPRRFVRVLGVWLLVLGALWALLWAATRYALPSLLRSQLQEQASLALGRSVQVQAVELSLLDLTATVHGLSVAGAEPSALPQVRVARVFVDVDARSLLRLAPVLNALQIDEPELRLARVDEGRYDIDDVLARIAARPKSDEPARFALYNVQLRGGRIDFDDRPVQRQHEVRGLQLALPFISNLSDDVKVHVEPALAFSFDGAAVDLRGRALPFADDHASELELKLAALDLSRWWAYLPAGLPVAPQGGSLSTQLALRFAQAPKQAPRVQLSGQIELKDFALQDGRGAPLAAWRTLALQLADVQPLQRKVALATLRLDGAVLHVRRDGSGGLNLPPQAAKAANKEPAANQATTTATHAPKAAAASAAAPTPTTTEAPGAAWQFSLDRTELVDGTLHWNDATTAPAAAFQLQGLNATTERVTWPSAQPTAFRVGTHVLAAGKPAAGLQAEGSASASQASVKFVLETLRLGSLAPYLRAHLKPELQGTAHATAQLEWTAAGPGTSGAPASAGKLQVQLPRLKLDKLRLLEGNSVALDVGSLQLTDLKLDVFKRRAFAQSFSVGKPSLVLQRAADGTLNVQRWLVTAAAPAAAASGAARASAAASDAVAEPWRAELAELQLEGGQITFHDDAARPGGERHSVFLQGLNTRLGKLQWPSGSQPVPLQLSAQLASASAGAAPTPAGSLSWQGQATLAPLGVRGTLQMQRLSTALAEPYVAALLPLRVHSAELGWRGELQATQESAGWRVAANGEAQVAELDLRSRGSTLAPAGPTGPSTQAANSAGAQAADTQLLAWQLLQLKPLSVALAPGGKPRVEVGELALSDFYARLVITEQGRFNLSDLQGPAPAAAAPVPPATAASAAKPKATELPLDLLITSTQLQRGRVDFSDRFVRPNYSAALSELEGNIGRLASGTRDMAPVALKGRVAGTGLLDIRGALNPTAQPLALDIQARATDLELAPLSPYSGKYAGYAIERGKLSVDVSYKIDAGGKLEASNQIILNQLTFGEKVDSPDATKLPVRFALSLLADRNGVIDINLPVSGSLDDPQFSVFGIVMKLIGNLIVKALTAPFSLLFGGGGGEEASVLEFEAGSARLLASATPSLEKVAKALSDKPSLRMTVAGSADASEEQAYRAELLRRALQDEWRRERARAGVAEPGPAPAPGSAEHTALLKRLYTQSAVPNKPRNLLGMLKDLPAAEMQNMLLAALPVAPDAWRELALQRSLAVRDALVARGLGSERLFLGAPKSRDAADNAWRPRVNLSLAAP